MLRDVVNELNKHGVEITFEPMNEPDLLRVVMEKRLYLHKFVINMDALSTPDINWEDRLIRIIRDFSDYVDEEKEKK